MALCFPRTGHLETIDVDHGKEHAAGTGRPEAHEDGDRDDATAIQIPMTSASRGTGRMDGWGC